MLNRRANRCAHLALNTPAAGLAPSWLAPVLCGGVGCSSPDANQSPHGSHMRAPHHMHHTHGSLARRRAATQARPRRPRRHRGRGGGGGGGDRGRGSILFGGRPRERHGRPGCESGGGLLGRSEPPRAGVPRESASVTCYAQDAGATQTGTGERLIYVPYIQLEADRNRQRLFEKKTEPFRIKTFKKKKKGATKGGEEGLDVEGESPKAPYYLRLYC